MEDFEARQNEQSTDTTTQATQNQPQQGNMPQGDMQIPDDFQPGQMPQGDMQMPDDFQPGQMPQNDMQIPDDFQPEQMPQGDQPGQGGKGGGMGSDDVKLKYIDDNYDSYTNIFNNAKTKITNTDKDRLIASLKNLSEYKDLENTINMEEVLRYFVIHNFVCNEDSYTGTMVHNYYLYEEDGKLSMIPWDYNLAFGTFQGNDASGIINSSIDSPVNGDVNDRPMVGWIFSNEKYIEMYHTLFNEFINSNKLESMIEETYNLIRPYVEKDPTKFCTLEEFDTAKDAISTFATLRLQAVKQQLNGNTDKVDTGTLNLSDMGTMNNGQGGQQMPMDNGEMPNNPFENGEMPTQDFNGFEKPDRKDFNNQENFTPPNMNPPD
ncbi:MAG: CotH kinase family protein [Holdemanella sp.]|nr:CotH kinase family protein [Holdemanella sp.]